MEGEYPFDECKSCQDLGDCPSPEISLDGYGSPLPPANCPQEIEIMRKTERRLKLMREKAKQRKDDLKNKN